MRQRYAFVDGLRGLAAVSVMLFHLGTGDLRAPLSRALSSVSTAAFGYGWIGVHVFFTLSGFVIAHSLGRTRLSPWSALRFSLRRQVRLDPPYWCAIAVGAVLASIAARMRPSVPRFVPSVADVVAHVFYANDLLGRPGISSVFWSLCIEVQFYLLFVLVVLLLQRFRLLLPWALAGSAVASLHSAITWRFPHAWFTQHWYLFALGALVRWSQLGRAWPGLPALLAVSFVAFGVHHDRLEPVAGGLVAGALLLAHARDALGRWLAARPLQFCGTVSYGIYLFHTPFAGPVHAGLARLVDPRSPAGAVVIVVAQLVTSFALATLLHRTVEGWAIRMAERIRFRDVAAERG